MLGFRENNSQDPNGIAVTIPEESEKIQEILEGAEVHPNVIDRVQVIVMELCNRIADLEEEDYEEEHMDFETWASIDEDRF